MPTLDGTLLSSVSNALITLLWMLIDAKVGSCFTLVLAFSNSDLVEACRLWRLKGRVSAER